MNDKINNSLDEPFVCPKCGQRRSSVLGAQIHMDNHSKQESRL